MWVRGLKSGVVNGRQIIDVVAPHVGAWIEIAIGFRAKKANGVAPHVGAWIEIHHIPLPRSPNAVAPHVGAWIEMYRLFSSAQVKHVPLGVDLGSGIIS